MEKVSILIPVYNAEKHLEETILSALNQSWENTEVIIVDDESSDASLAIAKKYSSDRLKVISQKNSGAAVARNLAFSKSTGDFIQFLDADDLLSSDKISSQMGILKQYPNDVIISCKWARFQENPEEANFIQRPLWRNLSPIDWMITAWSIGDMMQTACWLTPRTIIEKAGPWNTTYKHNPADDGEFFCRVMAQSEQVIFDPSALVYYRDHPGDRLSKKISRDSVAALLLNCHTYREVALHIKDSEEVRKAVAKKYINFIYRFHPDFPDLIKEAKLEVKKLNINKKPLAGGKRFKFISSIVGIYNALEIRRLSNQIWPFH